MQASLQNKSFSFFKREDVKVTNNTFQWGFSVACVLISACFITCSLIDSNSDTEIQDKVFSSLGKSPEVSQMMLKDIKEATQIGKNEYKIVKKGFFITSSYEMVVNTSLENAKVTWTLPGGVNFNALKKFRANNAGNVDFIQTTNNLNQTVVEINVKYSENLVVKFN